MKRARKSHRVFHRMAAFALCCFLLPLNAAGAEEDVMRLEAEDGLTRGHVKVASSNERSWVEGFQEDGDQVEMTIQIQRDGLYDVRALSHRPHHPTTLTLIRS